MKRQNTSTIVRNVALFWFPVTGTMTVNIKVTDINDNYPEFDNHTYHVTIEENIPIGE